MKTFQKIIIGCFLLLLSACGEQNIANENFESSQQNSSIVFENKNNSEEVDVISADNLKAMIDFAKKTEKSAEIQSEVKMSGNKAAITLKVSNPDNREILSVRSWLTYNPKEVEVIDIITDHTDFEIVAPGEDSIDEQNGVIKIGRGAGSKKLNKRELLIGTVLLEKKTDRPTLIDFYNYTENTDGHTQVSARIEGESLPINILKKPEESLLLSNT